jgi:hypothetical protein
MRFSDIDFTPPRRKLRQFAALWIVFFAALAAWQAWGHERWTLAAVLGILAVTVGPVGLARPEWLRPIFVGWMVLVFPIGWLVSHVVLAVMFYGLFTPLGLLFRLTGRDALGLRCQKDSTTYWQAKPQATNLRRYFRQF